MRDQDASSLLPVLQAYKKAQSEGTLLQMDFTTVNDYLWILREMAGVLSVMGRRGMFYLAAAVSDFFLPLDKIVSHATLGIIQHKMSSRPHVFSG